jgi:hypothetical protein
MGMTAGTLTLVYNTIPPGAADFRRISPVSYLGEGHARRSGNRLIWKAPDLLDEIKDGRLQLGQLLGKYAIEEFRAILTGLIGLFIRRQFGEKHPEQQLNLVNKFVFPQTFEVPPLWTRPAVLQK